MSNENAKNEVVINELIETYKEAGFNASSIKSALIKKEFDKDLVAELVKVRTSDGLTEADIIKRLGESPLTEKELYELILNEGTANEARWVLARNKVRLVINAVFAKYIEVEEEKASDELIKLVKEKVGS